MGRCQKVQNHPTSWLSNSIFYVKNYPNLSQFFFHWRISILEHVFCYWHLLIIPFFKSLHFLKRCPIFETSPLHQFSKFNNFLRVCWFRQKYFQFCIPCLKTGQPIPPYSRLAKWSLKVTCIYVDLCLC